MNREQQDLVRSSFAKLAPDADVIATVFYAFLFEIDPSLRPLFKGDMSRQRALLMSMLATAVENLHQIEQILPAVRSLGQRHAGYGVSEADYDTVAAALLLSLAQGLGDDFTPAVRDAWAACYETLAGAMKSAAREQLGRGIPRQCNGHQVGAVARRAQAAL